MYLATLPPELYTAILSHIQPPNLQVATLNLSRAIPVAPVPLYPLFEHITLSRQQQVPQLYTRLYYPPKVPGTGAGQVTINEAVWVKSLTLSAWQVDADVLVNLLALLPRLENISLNIGTLFTPEHMQDILREPASSLSMLTLRFRPYVQRATYLQFLKGSYFDGTIELISQWSSSTLSCLSIIQDPSPPLPVEFNTKSFAQPIVFFSLTPLTTLSFSPAMQLVTHLRLRIPARQITRFITNIPPGNTNSLSPFFGLIYLDLSTCAVQESSELETLLIHIGGGQLQHVVLDKTGLCYGTEGEWHSLGRACALVGVKKAREREKTLKAWTEAQSAASANGQDNTEADVPVVQERRPRRGRRGLATATISLRDTPTQDALILPTIHPERSSKAAKIRILPPPPRLLSLSTSLCAPLGHNHPVAEGMQAHEDRARSDFAKGWSEGASQLRATWARLRQSQSNGVRIVRFHAGQRDSDQAMLAGLMDVGNPEGDGYWEALQDINPPVLCFAGARGEASGDLPEDEWPNHPDGCGHRIAWNVWRDNL